MAKRVRVKIGKHNGDDAYSWAVFKDGQPVYTGCAKREAAYYRDRIRKEIGEK